jgi:hypothetical protein
VGNSSATWQLNAVSMVDGREAELSRFSLCGMGKAGDFSLNAAGRQRRTDCLPQIGDIALATA